MAQMAQSAWPTQPPLPRGNGRAQRRRRHRAAASSPLQLNASIHVPDMKTPRWPPSNGNLRTALSSSSPPSARKFNAGDKSPGEPTFRAHKWHHAPPWNLLVTTFPLHFPHRASISKFSPNPLLLPQLRPPPKFVVSDELLSPPRYPT